MSNQLTTKLTLKSAAFSRVFPGFLHASRVCSVLRGAGSLARCHLPTRKLRRGTPLRSSLPDFAANVPSPELSPPFVFFVPVVAIPSTWVPRVQMISHNELKGTHRTQEERRRAA